MPTEGGPGPGEQRPPGESQGSPKSMPLRVHLLSCVLCYRMDCRTQGNNGGRVKVDGT